MEALALLPTDLAALAEPMARPAAAARGALAVGDLAAPGGEAFADFLAFLAAPLEGGEGLPLDGKPLPLPLPETVLDGAEAPSDAAVAQAPADAAATTAALAVWLALRADSNAPAAVPLEAVPEPAVTLPGARPANTAPSGAPQVPFTSVATQALATAAPGSADTIPLDIVATRADTAPGAIEVASPAAAAAMTEAIEVPLDELPSSEMPFAGATGRTGASPAASAPTLPSASPAGAAAWLAPAGEAAMQTAARAVDTSSGTPRAPRRGEPVVSLAAPAVGLAEAAAPAAAGPTDWLPPVATPGTATPSAAAPAAASALPQAPVDTDAPQWHEAFAGRVQWLVDQRVGEARIRLNPPELGAVDVKISLVEDKTYVQLTAATAAARDELAQSLPRLRELFTASGLELGGASVQGGGRGGQAGAGAGTGGGTAGGYDPSPRYGADLPALELPAAHEGRRLGHPAPGVIDVFA